MNDNLSQRREESKIGRLKKSLYEKSKKLKRKPPVPLKQRKYKIQDVWRGETLADSRSANQFKKRENPPTSGKKRSFLKKLLVFSVLFFIASFGVAFYMFYGGINIVSTENVDLSIVGPTMVGGGEELSFQITVQNNNSVDLELTDLIVDFPKGTMSVGEQFKELTRERKSLGVVPAGGSVTKIFKAILFGSEGDQKDLIITVEYRAEDSNAIFFKDKKYEVVVDSSPLGLSVDFPAQVMSGQEFEFTVEITSNSSEVIKDFLLVADYPFGFDFKKSNLSPSYGNNIWNLGNIQPNSKTTLKIRSVLTGQDGEERVFSFSGGARDEQDRNAIKATLISSMKSVFVKKTLLGLDLALDGNYDSEYIAPTEETIRGDILWSNNLPTQLSDVKIVAKLKGTVLNKISVSSDDGFYNSTDNTIVWDKKNSRQLELLSPGASGNLSFSFAPHSLAVVSNLGIQNPEIVIDIIITGNKLSQGDSFEKVSATISKKIKIKSDMFLTARSLYSVGEFNNSGPIPPQADKETNYTIVWTATNTSNDIHHAKAYASLPSYVRWLGVSYPHFEDITFSQVGGKIVWDIGDIKAGQGAFSSAKEVSFQVALLPSLSQVNSEPILVNDIFIEGEDSFTGELIKYPVKNLTTRLSTDPSYNTGDGYVVK